MKWLFEHENVMVQFSVCPGGVLSVRTSAQCYNTLDDFSRAADALVAYRSQLESGGHVARHVALCYSELLCVTPVDHQETYCNLV